MDDTEILALIEEMESRAQDASHIDDMASAIDAYNGINVNPAPEGRSQVVDRTVCSTVEAIKPSLVKIFLAGDEVVAFTPRGPEDVPAAEQETAAVNHVVLELNPGYSILLNWFHDALLNRVGYVRATWHESEDTQTETYVGLSPEQQTLLLQDQAAEVVGTEVDEDGRQLIRIKRKRSYGCVKIENLPPEQVVVSHRHTEVSLMNADYVSFWTHRSIGDLRAEGYDVPDDIGDWDDSTADTVQDSRDEQTGVGWWQPDDDEAGARRRVKCREVWAQIDYDGDGIAERRHIVCIGKDIVENEPCDVIPVAAICPYPMPHRHIGRSVWDDTDDIQAIKTALLRGYLDNLYLSNHSRMAADQNRVNLDDLLVSRPGGIVRTQGSPGEVLMPLQHPTLGPMVLQGLEYVDGMREVRTGITRYQQGLDADSLNKTATGMSLIQNAANQRLEMIARNFAEAGGVKDLFLIVHALMRKHATEPLILRLKSQFVPVDPRNWRERKDLSISVGLGYGNKDQQLMHLNTIISAQMQMLPLGIANPKNLYNALAKLTTNAGFRTVEEFWTDPATAPPMQQPQDPKVVLEQARLQDEQQREAAKLMQERQKMQIDAQQTAQQAQIDAALEAQKLQLEKYKAELQAQTQLAIKQIEIQASAAIEGQRMAVSHEHEMHKLGMGYEREDKMEQVKNVDLRAELLAQIQAMLEAQKAVAIVPVRGPDGRIVGGRVQTQGGETREVRIG